MTRYQLISVVLMSLFIVTQSTFADHNISFELSGGYNFGLKRDPGYFENELKNSEAFIYPDKSNKGLKLYKTGDWVYLDSEGDYIFCGRIDNQIQINGYRVELGEIEQAAQKFGYAIHYKAIAKTSETEIIEYPIIGSVPISNKKPRLNLDGYSPYKIK